MLQKKRFLREAQLSLTVCTSSQLSLAQPTSNPARIVLWINTARSRIRHLCFRPPGPYCSLPSLTVCTQAQWRSFLSITVTCLSHFFFHPASKDAKQMETSEGFNDLQQVLGRALMPIMRCSTGDCFKCGPAIAWGVTPLTPGPPRSPHLLQLV